MTRTEKHVLDLARRWASLPESERDQVALALHRLQTQTGIGAAVLLAYASGLTESEERQNDPRTLRVDWDPETGTKLTTFKDMK